MQGYAFVMSSVPTYGLCVAKWLASSWVVEMGCPSNSRLHKRKPGVLGALANLR